MSAVEEAAQLDIHGDLHPVDGSTNGTGEITAPAITVTIPEAEVVGVASKQSQAGPRLRITLDARLGAERVAVLGLVGTTVTVEMQSSQTAFVFEAVGQGSGDDDGDKTG